MKSMMASSQFVHIDNPKKEQEVIKQFSELQQFLRSRNREERLREMNISEENTKLFSPVIDATRESANQITQQLVAQGQQQQQQQQHSVKMEEGTKAMTYDQQHDGKKYFKIFFDIMRLLVIVLVIKAKLLLFLHNFTPFL